MYNRTIVKIISHKIVNIIIYYYWI